VAARERAKLSRNNDTTKAINYCLSRCDAFTRFLDDGRLCMSNKPPWRRSPASLEFVEMSPREEKSWQAIAGFAVVAALLIALLIVMSQGVLLWAVQLALFSDLIMRWCRLNVLFDNNYAIVEMNTSNRSGSPFRALASIMKICMDIIYEAFNRFQKIVFSFISTSIPTAPISSMGIFAQVDAAMIIQ
jgi:hypothetical protein